MGVFATRSPFRPNPLGLSSVRLLHVSYDDDMGTVLTVAGADMMDGTPIYDIKPYIPYTDSHPEASGGFAERVKEDRLQVIFADEWLQLIPPDKRDALYGVLRHDPRPSYQHDPTRQYGFVFAGFEIKFTVVEDTLLVNKVEVAR